VTSTSFQIGNRGGPGRPRRDVAVPIASEVCKLARSFSQEALETLVKMMRNAKLPGAVPRDRHSPRPKTRPPRASPATPARGSTKRPCAATRVGTARLLS
jgi:hypothetical protein